jgi:hypothetical protein
MTRRDFAVLASVTMSSPSTRARVPRTRSSLASKSMSDRLNGAAVNQVALCSAVGVHRTGVPNTVWQRIRRGLENLHSRWPERSDRFHLVQQAPRGSRDGYERGAIQRARKGLGDQIVVKRLPVMHSPTTWMLHPE